MPSILCPVLIGRDDEMGTLRDLMNAASQGHGGLVIIQGDAGVGKSRLVREVRRDGEAAGMMVVSGRAVPAATAAAYRPLAEPVLQAMRFRDAPIRADLEAWLPLLEQVLGEAPRGRDETMAMSPAWLGEAVTQVLLGHAGSRGVVVLLEDLHWSDPETLGAVEYIADNAGERGLLLVVTIRTGTSSEAEMLAQRLHSRRAATTIQLDRLSDEEVVHMVRACVPDPSDETVRRILETADGVPFLVEELLASPGVPRSLIQTVRERLGGLGATDRSVLEGAALLGRHFDWRVLPDAVGVALPAVSTALGRGVGIQLLAADGAGFRFRHALTRDAVLESMLPPRRAALAAGVLAALESRSVDVPPEVSASLAEQAGDRRRAGELLAAAGAAALDRGALATAVETLRRAVQLLTPGDALNSARITLIEALALAGHVDDAVRAGDGLLPRIPSGKGRAELHVTLAAALVTAGRWAAATAQLDAAEAAAGPFGGLAVLGARVAVLRAEIDLASDHFELARRHAGTVLTSASATSDLRCHALELIGRSHRTRDLGAARAPFEEALRTARGADLPLAMLRATHELGTIDMFDQAGTARLLEARQLATQLGALATGAVLDMHLAAVFMFRFDLNAAERHADASAAMSGRLSLGELHALALLFTGQIAALRCRRDVMERHFALAAAVAVDDPNIEGSAWCGGRGMFALLTGDDAAAMQAFSRGVSMLRRLPNAGPANYRGLWPLLLAAAGDPHSADAIQEARRNGMAVNRCNRGFLKYAEAVLSGRRGERTRATELAQSADADLVYFPVWEDLGRMQAAPAAIDDHWGDPRRWLETARERFRARDLPAMVDRCSQLLSAPPPTLAGCLGITPREAEVLDLIARGLSNKDIAAALNLSPRTVEKHVESLLRKVGARSRTELVAIAGSARG